MNASSTARVRWVVAVLASAMLALVAGQAQAREGPASVAPDTVPFTVDGRLALHSLMSLGDGHLQEMADFLSLIAGTEAARSADWERIRAPLAEAAERNVPAVLWFAVPDGGYWTLEEGRAGDLSDRPYFPRVLAGETVIGELVVSRSTHRNTAIVAVPVRGPDDAVVGVLGSSIQLDSLSVLMRREMGGLDPGLVFFAIDSEPLGAVHSDPAMVFTEPMELGDEGMRNAFTQILAGEEGVVTYTFRESRRTVLYRKSSVSGWWYGFGVLEE